MEIGVRLHGILRDQLPPQAKGRATITLNQGATVQDLLDRLAIQRRVVVALNEQGEADTTQALQDGDQVSIYTLIGGG